MDNKKITSEIATIQIYGQDVWHDPVLIIGNEQALLALKQAIDGALKAPSGESNFTAMVNDGERYVIVVKKVEGQFDWSLTPLPYTDEMAKGKENLNPFSVLNNKDIE